MPLDIKFKISGIVSNSWYMSKEEERNIVTGNALKAIFYKDFTLETLGYTNLFIRSNFDNKLNQFSKKYTNRTNNIVSGIEDSVLDDITTRRLDKINSIKKKS